MNKSKTKVFEDFFSQFQLRSYKQGEMLIRADDDPQGIFASPKDMFANFLLPHGLGLQQYTKRLFL